MINSCWLELPLSRINFHGPKGVRAIEVRLYLTLKLQNRQQNLPLQNMTIHFCQHYIILTHSYLETHKKAIGKQDFPSKIE